MKIQRFVKDPQSRTGSCAAVYEAEDVDRVVVQGSYLDDDTSGRLIERADYETGVSIPASVLLLAADRFRKAHPEQAAAIDAAEQDRPASA